MSELKKNQLLPFSFLENKNGKIDTLGFLKKGSKIHIKKSNRGKFTDYCGGKVTDACIRRAKASGNPTLVKRATFAANARKWKHENGGILKGEIGLLLDPKPDANSRQTEARNWFKSKYGTINWNNLKYIYNTLKSNKIPYDTAMAVLGNIVHESQGDYRKRQIGGGPGYGLLQWNKGTEPGNTLELQTQGIVNILKSPAGSDNYWYHGGKGSGFKTGEDARSSMMKKNNYEFSRKSKLFSDTYLRPGKPNIEDRIVATKYLVRLPEFPEYERGGEIL